MAPSAAATLLSERNNNKSILCKNADLVVPIAKCTRSRRKSNSKLNLLANVVKNGNGGGASRWNNGSNNNNNAGGGDGAVENCGANGVGLEMDLVVENELKEEMKEEQEMPMTNGNNRKVDPSNYDDLLWLSAEIRAMAGLRPGEHPRVGIICGSGLGALADQLEHARVLPFAQLPGFPQANVVGHKGNLVFGRLTGQLCVCLQGRFHPYEHAMDMVLCTMPVRIMALLGVRTMIVSNAAGGINPGLQVGDLMIIKDHVFLPGLAGFSPLIGLKDPRFGPRFVSLHDAYDRELRQRARALAEQIGAPVKEGIYVMNGGPQYETAAECAFLARLGGDAVGMSTCHELTVARQCGIRVFGFSLITNCASLDADQPVEVCHNEVLQAARVATETASQWMANLVASLVEEAAEEEMGERKKME